MVENTCFFNFYYSNKYSATAGPVKSGTARAENYHSPTLISTEVPLAVGRSETPHNRK